MAPPRNAKTNVTASLGGALGLALAFALASSLGAAGCGSSDGNSSADGGGGGGRGGAGGGGIPGNGTITWKDDGAAHATSFSTASLVTQSGIQLLQIAGGEGSGFGIAFGVTAMPAPLAPGSYSCGIADGGGYPITSFSYTDPAGGVEPLYESCSVTIATLGDADGEHTTGAFSAVLTKTAGGTRAITDGSFDVVLNVTP